jgi:hypothetical protein
LNGRLVFKVKGWLYFANQLFYKEKKKKKKTPLDWQRLFLNNEATNLRAGKVAVGKVEHSHELNRKVKEGCGDAVIAGGKKPSFYLHGQDSIAPVERKARTCTSQLFLSVVPHQCNASSFTRIEHFQCRTFDRCAATRNMTPLISMTLREPTSRLAQ